MPTTTAAFQIEPLEPRVLLSAGGPIAEFDDPTPPGVTLVFDADNPIDYRDAAGRLVSVSLKGEGLGNLAMPIDPGAPPTVWLDGTTTDSQLTIRTRGNHHTPLAGLRIADPIGQIRAKTTDLVGDANLDAIQRLELGDIVNSVLTIEADNDEDIDARRGLTITLGSATDASLTTDHKIKSLTATQWVGLDELDDTIDAPAIERLFVRGLRRLGIDGDFNAALSLTGAGMDERDALLRLARIAGDVTGTNWSVPGRVDRVQINGTAADTQLTFDSLRALKITRADTLTLAAGTVGTILSNDWLDGRIEAESVNSIRTAAVKRHDLDGDLSADLALGVAGDQGGNHKARTVGSVNVAGDVIDAVWSILGKAGVLNIRGDVAGLEVGGPSHIARLALGDVESASVSAERIAAVQAVRWLSGDLTAGYVGLLRTVGNHREAKLGDFGAALALTSTFAGGPVLGAALIAGSILAPNWTLEGTVNRIKTARIAQEFEGVFDGLVRNFQVITDMAGTFDFKQLGKLDVGGDIEDAFVTIRESIRRFDLDGVLSDLSRFNLPDLDDIEDIFDEIEDFFDDDRFDLF